jgi:hypothetical protein
MGAIFAPLAVDADAGKLDRVVQELRARTSPEALTSPQPSYRPGLPRPTATAPEPRAAKAARHNRQCHGRQFRSS